jgi:hypothetical protein
MKSYEKLIQQNIKSESAIAIRGRRKHHACVRSYRIAGKSVRTRFNIKEKPRNPLRQAPRHHRTRIQRNQRTCRNETTQTVGCSSLRPPLSPMIKKLFKNAVKYSRNESTKEGKEQNTKLHSLRTTRPRKLNGNCPLQPKKPLQYNVKKQSRTPMPTH